MKKTDEGDQSLVPVTTTLRGPRPRGVCFFLGVAVADRTFCSQSITVKRDYRIR